MDEGSLIRNEVIRYIMSFDLEGIRKAAKELFGLDLLEGLGQRAIANRCWSAYLEAEDAFTRGKESVIEARE